jgi:monofunctional biosynthetic peptidoglycan transglycosylase
MIIFDLTEPEAARRFSAIDDRVMGGVSKSGLLPAEGIGIFAGEVSFESGGGFASVRSETGSWDLSGFEGVELLVRGDGKTYKFSITTDTLEDSVVYRARFAAGDDWETVRIPFSSFMPSFRGVVVPHAPPLDTAAIASFGFLIADHQEGAFRLEVNSIKAY